ncbi:hypothetical protein [Lysobacter antibioticus]|uniref:hypothetical protein n=1 Tax=Lysobacter antibioticus TaxID=84531 RepID=UPI00118768AC|nr:hypothetical protein [Lysobacter antibioticus]
MTYTDPCLLIHGLGWHLRLLTAWRVLDTGKFLIGSDEVDVPLLQSVLAGKTIVECRSQSSTAGFDPALVFATGQVLEVFSVSAIEPWIFSIDGAGPFVASPSA